MASENALLLYKASHEAQQKFEYFLTGVIGAMFAYIVQTYTPQRIDWSASTLEPVALIFLAGAFFLGLRRINCIYHLLGLNYEQTQASDDAKVIQKALQESESYNEGLSPAQRENMEGWIERLEDHKRRAKLASVYADKIDCRARLYYKLRSYLLIGGFVAILLARILSPYAN